MTLEQYFHKIVNTTPKELTMFERSVEYLKNKWQELTTTKYEFVESSELVLEDEDYWAFEMSSTAYVCDGESVPAQHDVIIQPNDGTWVEALDKILDVMSKHYGYNIKEQVYYSVHFPYNVEGEAGHGRSLNDEVLQQLLLAYPEVYEVSKPE